MASNDYRHLSGDDTNSDMEQLSNESVNTLSESSHASSDCCKGDDAVLPSLRDDAKTQPAETTTRYQSTGTKRNVSVGIFNTRKFQYMTALKFYKYEAVSVSHDHIIAEVAKAWTIHERYVFCIEDKGQLEETAIKTYVVILPEHASSSISTLLLECYATPEQRHPDVWCLRIERNWTINKAKAIVTSCLRWKGVGLCRRRTLLSDSVTFNELNIKNFDRLQAVSKAYESIKFYHQPRANLEQVYTIIADASASVMNIKQKLVHEFGDNMQDDIKQSIIHVGYRDTLLDDSHCFGLINRQFRDEPFRIHFAAANVFCITVKYRYMNGKHRATTVNQLVIRPNCSTSFLRGEVAKHIHVDPKAIKLTINNKRVDELDNLQTDNVLCEGCVVNAGVKKRKTILVKHPTDERVAETELYTLETVDTLKAAVAKEFGMDVRHVALLCRGTEMQDNELLLHYPLKNRMLIDLVIYERRTVLNIRISLVRRMKASLSVMVDDSSMTTVDDVMRFCGHTYNYPRCCSRAIFKQRCLDKMATIEESNLQCGDTIVIVFFDPLDTAVGDLRRVFTVDENGMITQRYGSIVNGVLLHASKKVEIPAQKEEDHLKCNGHMPTGIHTLDPTTTRDNVRKLKVQQDKITERDEENRKTYTPAEIKNLKKNFLQQANKVVSMRLSGTCKNHAETKRKEKAESREQTIVKDVYVQNPTCKSGDDSSSDQNSKTYNVKMGTQPMDDMAQAENQIEESGTPSKTPVFYVQQSDNENENTDVSDTSEQSDKINSNTNQVYVTDQRDKCKQTDTQATSCESESTDCECDESVTCIKETLGSSNNIHFCEHKGESHEQQQNALIDIGMNSLPPGGNIEHTVGQLNQMVVDVQGSPNTDRHDNNYNISNKSQSRMVPYIRCKSKMDIVVYGHTHKGKRRRRTRTEGEQMLDELKPFLPPIPLNTTYPDTFHDRLNENINTAGITVPLLLYISREVGQQWKTLARKLEVPESTINNIGHEHRYELAEACMQALLCWKQTGGKAATKTNLIEVLKKIDRNDLVDSCENSDLWIGYHTA